MKNAVSDLQQLIKTTSRIVVMTGAGISTESGIPDFRSPGGIWSKYRVTRIQEFIASHEARRNYWRYKTAVYPDIESASPNAGHLALVKLEKLNKLQLIITQNIDGLHQKAGNNEKRILELHGTELEVKCLKCHARFDRLSIHQRVLAGDEVPTCDYCCGWLKPATISFGQTLHEAILNRAISESKECEAFLVIGSSLIVYPAASLPEIAKQQGAWLGILNRESTPLDAWADWVCHESIGAVLSEALR